MDKHKSILFQLNPNAPTFATDFQICATKFDPQRREVLSTIETKTYEEEVKKAKTTTQTCYRTIVKNF
jgi:hypothetical protein